MLCRKTGTEIRIQEQAIKVKKTFPGCVRSLSGYPVTGIEDTNNIKYLLTFKFSNKLLW